MLFTLLAAYAAPPTWLEGCWTTKEQPVTREIWLTQGAVAVGAGASGPADKPSWEHLWWGELEGTLTYVASPAGQARATFAATSVSADRVVFENPAHDFPQRITYSHAGDALTVRVEARRDEGWKGFTLAFTRCAAP